MQDLDIAKRTLANSDYTCVLCRDGALTVSERRGVAPLLEWLETGISPGFCAADKVVGRATAYLYCLLGVKAVYAQVMSTAAMEVLQTHGIDSHCEKEVPCIINRRGDGPCPFEAAVWEILDPALALEAIHRKQIEMTIR